MTNSIQSCCFSTFISFSPVADRSEGFKLRWLPFGTSPSLTKEKGPPKSYRFYWYHRWQIQFHLVVSVASSCLVQMQIDLKDSIYGVFRLVLNHLWLRRKGRSKVIVSTGTTDGRYNSILLLQYFRGVYPSSRTIWRTEAATKFHPNVHAFQKDVILKTN